MEELFINGFYKCIRKSMNLSFTKPYVTPHFGPMCITPLLMLTPPKIDWYRDTGPVPWHYRNRLGVVQDMNTWIVELNASNNIGGVLPNFRTWGTRCLKDWRGLVRSTHR